MTLKHIVFISSKDDWGDFTILDTFTSFNTATNSITSCAIKYLTDRQLSYIITDEKKFDYETIRCATNSSDTYVIKTGKYGATIYHKKIESGWTYNTYTLTELYRVNVKEINLDDVTELDEIPIANEVNIINNYVTNQERGKHVTLIEELKQAIAIREQNKTMNNSDIIISESRINTENTHAKFVNALRLAKSRLRKLD